MLSKFDSVMTLLDVEPRLAATWPAAATWLCRWPDQDQQPDGVRSARTAPLGMLGAMVTGATTPAPVA